MKLQSAKLPLPNINHSTQALAESKVIPGKSVECESEAGAPKQLNPLNRGDSRHCALSAGPGWPVRREHTRHRETVALPSSIEEGEKGDRRRGVHAVRSH